MLEVSTSGAEWKVDRENKENHSFKKDDCKEEKIFKAPSEGKFKFKMEDSWSHLNINRTEPIKNKGQIEDLKKTESKWLDRIAFWVL